MIAEIGLRGVAFDNVWLIFVVGWFGVTLNCDLGLLLVAFACIVTFLGLLLN